MQFRGLAPCQFFNDFLRISACLQLQSKHQPVAHQVSLYVIIQPVDVLSCYDVMIRKGFRLRY